ncbi:hypothetical protein [Phormidesmis priestleyi]|uniref:hypothetical protein n=1 Tax=Phormidesmis priestleyi TaxID=268141 RepID=UPI00083A06A4|nr:hypothetical protein [Phormidesmis priestleyi]
MSAQLLSQEGTQVRIEVTIDLSHSLLTSEEAIQESLNEAGRIATTAALEYLDTGCDLYLILLEGNGKAVLIQFVPELIPTR